MSTTTPNLGLTLWTSASDVFDYNILANNLLLIDGKFSASTVSTTPIRFIESLAAVPSSGNTQGRLVYLTAANSGFAANSILQYNGTSWSFVGNPEIQSSVPTNSNYQGRMIILSAAASGFSANDVIINTDGANTWQRVGGVQVVTSVAASTNNYNGKLIVLSQQDNAAPGGPYQAYTALVYNNTTGQYQNVANNGVQTGTTLPTAPFVGQVFCLTANVGNYQAYDVLRWNGTSWQQLTNPPLVNNSTFNAYSSPPDGFEVYYQVSTGTNWHLRYNAGGSTYKWEYVGGPEIYARGTSNVNLTIPRDGEYVFTFGVLPLGSYGVASIGIPGGNVVAYSYNAAGNNITGAFVDDVVVSAGNLSFTTAGTPGSCFMSARPRMVR